MNDNRIIADFMGVVFHDDENQYYNADGLHIGNTLQYHTSWDWLMPVLKKINLRLHPDTYGLWRMINTPTEYTIEEVHAQVVEFIKTFNEK